MVGSSAVTEDSAGSVTSAVVFFGGSSPARVSELDPTSGGIWFESEAGADGAVIGRTGLVGEGVDFEGEEATAGSKNVLLPPESEAEVVEGVGVVEGLLSAVLA